MALVSFAVVGILLGLVAPVSAVKRDLEPDHEIIHLLILCVYLDL